MSISTAISKTKRAIQKQVTGEEPEVDLLETLKEEHEEVADLLDRLVKSERAAERKSLFKQVKAALVPHARAEEKVLYDAIIRVKDKKAKTDGEEGYIEHDLADKTIAKLGKIIDVMSPQFSAGAKVLKELISHHVKEEERDVWDDAKDNYDSDERKKMNVRYLELKKKVKVPA